MKTLRGYMARSCKVLWDAKGKTVLKKRRAAENQSQSQNQTGSPSAERRVQSVYQKEYREVEKDVRDDPEYKSSHELSMSTAHSQFTSQSRPGSKTTSPR